MGRSRSVSARLASPKPLAEWLRSSQAAALGSREDAARFYKWFLGQCDQALRDPASLQITIDRKER